MNLLLISKIAWACLVVAWFILRLPFEYKAQRHKVVNARHRTPRDIALLGISLSGLGIIPAIYVLTGWPKSLSYETSLPQLVAGVLVFLISLWLFWRTHTALGNFWSMTLEIKDKHRLITTGIYEKVRHPMYSAFFLWAVAQALILPNLVGGLAGLVGFGTLFFFRVGREEQMLRETFGADYDAYMARTKRIIPGVY